MKQLRVAQPKFLTHEELLALADESMKLAQDDARVHYARYGLKLVVQNEKPQKTSEAKKTAARRKAVPAL